MCYTVHTYLLLIGKGLMGHQQHFCHFEPNPYVGRMPCYTGVVVSPGYLMCLVIYVAVAQDKTKEPEQLISKTSLANMSRFEPRAP
jgi:hypothetical protein